MTAALSPSSTQSFPRLTIDISDALLAWLVGLIEEASQERLREIQNEILLIDGTAERPTVVFSKKLSRRRKSRKGICFLNSARKKTPSRKDSEPSSRS